MPSFNSKLVLSTAAQNNNTRLADIDRIRGAFRVYDTANEMNSIHPNYFYDGDIVYAIDSASLYKANVTLANPGEGIYEDSVSFTEFSFYSGSFVSASFDGVNTLTFFGQDLIGSTRISSSVDLSALTGSGGGGSGDITGVTAGDGLSGGGLTGGVTLTLNTSSVHFINAVNELGLFRATGSAYSTTNDIEITGSLSIADGLLKLKEYSTLPTAEEGAIAYSASSFYFGIE